MLTYQDLMKSASLTGFIDRAINEYKSDDMYKIAIDAEQYAKMQNTTIMNYRKLLYTITGESVFDNYSANHKCASNFFNRFIVQENQFLLGNGVTFEEEKTKEALGGDEFDLRLQRAGIKALIGGVSYGFLNLKEGSTYDVSVFDATEFVPLYDEETGALRSGIRFWQIAQNKPLRATLFEEDGYTEYLKKEGEWSVLSPKRAYINVVSVSEVDGTEILDGENYPALPIVPLWANPYHQSELVGLKEQIDAYDLIKSGFANDLDDVSMIYWTMTNAGGMDDVDLTKFLERLRVVKAVTIDDEVNLESHQIDIPYQSRESYLQRLENDLYNDAMALNMQQLASNATATAIRASYEPLNNKTDQYEYCVIDFIKGLLDLIRIEDSPTFKRSMIINQSEETQMVLSASQYLDDETILKHLPFLNPDEIDDILSRLLKEEASRIETVEEPKEQEEEEEEPEGENEEVEEE